MDFRPMRRGRQALDQAETEAILCRGTAGTLALLGDGGWPYAVPLSYVYHSGRIYFHCAKSGHKIDAIRTCDKASFCVIDKNEIVPAEFTTYYRSAIVFGRARIVEDEAERMEAMRALAAKYSPKESEDSFRIEMKVSGSASLCVVALDIELMSGKQAKELIKKEE
ncbi:MAG: pyridoxamine 5'-phosphate oxidase family protein [Oscillospiraceae bacterium]|nr:pyridoxamine 5'-phosphate oxidase family protein [Oscillospiraceae bacterium]